MNYETIQIKLARVQEQTMAPIKITTPEELATFCGDIKLLAQESFHVVLLNTHNKVINRVMVSLGLANSAEVHPREVFRQAIHENAIAILMVHNHPSGDPTPSAEDLRITRQLIAAGGVVDIRVLDHVVIGREEGGHPSFISMREQGLCNFDSV